MSEGLEVGGGSPGSYAALPTTAREPLTGEFTMVGYGVRADVVTKADAVITSGSAIVNSATAAFTSADVGKVAVLHNALGAGSHRFTTIASVQSATRCTLAATCTDNITTVMTYGTDDHVAAQACIDAAVAVRGAVRLPPTPFLTTVGLTVSEGVRIRGTGCHSIYGLIASSYATLAWPTVAPFLDGSVIVVAAPAIDALTLNVCAKSVDLLDFGIVFAGPFVNTGHGVTAKAPVSTTAFDNGLVDPVWTNIRVFGHDGNHYGFITVNAIYPIFTHLRAYGGGGIRFDNNSAVTGGDYGNAVITDFYSNTFVAGTAHGIHLNTVAAGANTGDLVAFYRPQTWISTSLYGSFAGYGFTVSDATQFNFRNDGYTHVDLHASDFEGGRLHLGSGPFSVGDDPYYGASGPDTNQGYPNPSVSQLGGVPGRYRPDDGNSIVNPPTHTFATRWDPLVVGVGFQDFASETAKPIWSDGNDFRYADGTVAFIAGTAAGAGTIPSSVSTGPVGWWEADNIAGSPADGSVVASWADLASSPHALVQATTNKKPVFKTGLVNGKPAVRFSGTTYLQALFTLAQPATIFVLYKNVGAKAVGTPSGVITDGGTGTAQMFATISAPLKPAVVTYSTGLYVPGGAGFPSSAAGYSDNVWAIATGQANGGSSLFRVNGTQVATGATGSAALGGITVGTKLDSTGGSRVDVAAIVVFDTALSNANMLAVERWLGTKYGIAVA